MTKSRWDINSMALVLAAWPPTELVVETSSKHVVDTRGLTAAVSLIKVIRKVKRPCSLILAMAYVHQ